MYLGTINTLINYVKKYGLNFPRISIFDCCGNICFRNLPLLGYLCQGISILIGQLNCLVLESRQTFNPREMRVVFCSTIFEVQRTVCIS